MTEQCAEGDPLCPRAESLVEYHASYASLLPWVHPQSTKTDCSMMCSSSELLAEISYLEHLVSGNCLAWSLSLIEKSYHCCWHPLALFWTPGNSTHTRSQTIEIWSDLSNSRCLTINFAWPLVNSRTSMSYWTSFGSCPTAVTFKSTKCFRTTRSHPNYTVQTSYYHNYYSPNLNYLKSAYWSLPSEASSNWHWLAWKDSCCSSFASILCSLWSSYLCDASDYSYAAAYWP